MAGDFSFNRCYALKWNGSNGATIATMCDANNIDNATWTLESESAGVQLVLRQTVSGGSYALWNVFPSAPWVVVRGDYQGIYARLSDADYANQFMSAVDLWSVAPMPTLTAGVGMSALPSLLLNGTTTQVVTLDVTMPSTAYVVKWRAIAGASVLTAIGLNGTITKTTTQVTIPLKASGLATVAGVLLVEAYLLA